MFSSSTKSAAQGGGYNLTKSLRFRSSASAYLNRTPGSASNRQTWTWSAWVKRGVLGSRQALFCGGSNATSTDHTYIEFSSSNIIMVESYASASSLFNLQTSAVYRDPSAWYHIVYVLDTTQATSTNRVKLYVNGTQVTAFSSATYPSQNYSGGVNTVSPQTIGSYSADFGPFYFDGYMADVNFVDGQALTASSFGSTNATTGVWQPAPYTGTYGTNGFYLPFTNITSTTTLGYDTSGNGNNYTTNNFSLTTGATYDSMTDVPTLTSATVANYCVLNPLDYNVNNIPTITNGNLTYTTNSAIGARSTIAMSSGKWYCEVRPTSTGNMLGIISSSASLTGVSYPGSTATGYGYYSDNGNKYNNNSNSAYGATYGNGDVIGIAFDADAGTLTYYKNNTSQGTAFTGLTSGPYSFVFGNGTSTGSFNFGQQPFVYTPPSGYKALNTYNLPDSTIVKGNKYMDATLYTGTLLSNAITNTASFKPDLVWIKSRSLATDNKLTDSVRGATKALISNTTGTETTDSQGLTSFNSNGFTVGTDTNYNTLSATYVGWQWQANQGSTSSNTNGSITSTVSANTTAGFSIVTYTGTGTNGTVGHGLGVAPKMIILKSRNPADSWLVYHVGCPTPATNTLILNLTDAVQTSSNNWNSTNPTSSVFSVYNPGSGGYSNGSGYLYVAYCWTNIAGFSAFGNYTGNGSSDGAFVYTGFRPKYVIIKRTDTANDWYILDSARNLYNPETLLLSSDANSADYDNGATLDFVANGFKIKNAGGAFGASGGNYVYAAFAENPFKNALAR
jgi:hypothetical protein